MTRTRSGVGGSRRRSSCGCVCTSRSQSAIAILSAGWRIEASRFATKPLKVEHRKVEHRKTKPYTPQTNGLVERFNGRVQREVLGIAIYNHRDLEKRLEGFNQAYDMRRQRRAQRRLTRSDRATSPCGRARPRQSSLRASRPTRLASSPPGRRRQGGPASIQLGVWRRIQPTADGRDYASIDPGPMISIGLGWSTRSRH
jgi:Integrase core domain